MMNVLYFLGAFCLMFYTTYSFSQGANPAMELEQNVLAIPGVGFQYNGENNLTQAQSQALLSQSQNAQMRLHSGSLTGPGGSCDERRQEIVGISPELNISSIINQNGQEEEDSDWRVVFIARMSASNNMVGQATTVQNSEVGTDRFDEDLAEMRELYNNGALDRDAINGVFDRAAQSMNRDPHAAMAYVARMGDILADEYGDSNAGTFVSRFEQYGRYYAGESVGQCSDIHFAMLKAYKHMVGDDAKAYLVNFQTGGDLHHTNLVIENEGQLSIIDYGNITTNSGGLDALVQQSRAGHGLAYRVFTDDGEIDNMVAHIDTPLGKFLREVTTGTASHNPFETSNYQMLSLALENSNGTHVRTFFGELGGGDVVMGVAVNLSGVNELPGGWTLLSHLSTALAYTHRTFRVDNNSESLHSEVIYLNTGLGIVSPKLEVGDFTFRARTDLTLEGGFWIKQYSDMDEGDSHFEGDGTIISRTAAELQYAPNDRFRLNASIEVELQPKFATAFPSSTDGSSGADGLWQTLGVLPNTITGNVQGVYTTPSGVDIFGGLTYQHTPLGPIGQAEVGVATENFQASTFIQGALTSETPSFVPGATPSIGVNLDWCTGDNEGVGMCLGVNGQKDLNGPNWQAGVTTTLNF